MERVKRKDITNPHQQRSMTLEEENYHRGYIDAKVEDMGKVRAYNVSDEERIAYRSRLLKEHNLTP